MTKSFPVRFKEIGLGSKTWRSAVSTKGSLDISAELVCVDRSDEVTSFLKILEVAEKDKKCRN